jgi:hypothetical protein
MSIISPHGKGQGPIRPTGRGEAIAGDIIVGAVTTAVGGFFSLVACAAIAMGAANAVQFAMSETGVLAAWVAQVSVSVGEPLSAEAIGGLILQNVLFGAALGLLFGIVQFALRWRKERHRWIVEAVVSPTGMAALRYGAATLALHVLISGLAAWAAGALFGIFLPSPLSLIGGGDAGLLLQGFVGSGGDGGAGGADLGEVLVRLLFLVVFAVLIAAVITCNLFAALSWLLFRFAPWATLGRSAGEGAISGVAHGAGALAAAVILQLAISRLGLKKEGWRGPDAVVGELRDGGKSFFHAFVTAALSGALHSVAYAALMLALPAVFGIVAAGE